MPLWSRLKALLDRSRPPDHLHRGRLGESAARSYLERAGLKFILANFRSSNGEIDLIFRDHECLAFVEVKARSHEDWTRPAMAVDRKRQRRLSHTALDYLRQVNSPKIRFRFDIVEVLLHPDGKVREIRHLPNAFPLTPPYRYH